MTRGASGPALEKRWSLAGCFSGLTRLALGRRQVEIADPQKVKGLAPLDLFGVRGRRLLANFGLPQPWQGTVEASLRLIEEIERAIRESERSCAGSAPTTATSAYC